MEESAHLLQQLDELALAHLAPQLAGLGHPDEDAFDLPRSLGTHKCDARDWGCVNDCHRVVRFARGEVRSTYAARVQWCPAR